jgi:integral membrane protein (TIGR00529 family)
MQATLYTLGAFALILVLARLKVPLTVSILIGAVTIGLLFQMTLIDIASSVVKGMVQPRTIGLVIITAFILALSAIMDSTGQLAEIVTLARQLLRRPAFAMAALPALIGLLPMPGGALFSAPMVRSASDNRVGGAELSAINYWYRHIWEHWWPLYPGVILAVALTGFTYSKFVTYQIVLGLFMICTGTLLFRKLHPDLQASSAAPTKGTKLKFIIATSSIWLIIVVWICVSLIFRFLILPMLAVEHVPMLEKYLPLGIGLAASIIITGLYRGLDVATVAKVFGRKEIWKLAVLVVSVMVFQYMLKEAKAAERIADELVKLNVPVVLVAAILPFIAGLVTGLAIGFVGTSFPIVLALVGAAGAGPIFPYVALAYGFGHLGQMVSPIHLCYVVSNQYFDVPFGRVYRRMLPTAILNAVLVAAYFFILKALT